MKLIKQGIYKYKNKQFLIYEDEKHIKYLAKKAALKDYPLLLQISEISDSNNNLAPIDYFSKQNKYLIYYTRLYPGDTLEQIIEKKTLLSIQQVNDIIYQIANGLMALHNCGIIHRDIKPANIILFNGNIKIIDYDISRLYDDNKKNDTSYLGTKEYASPEQYGFNQTTPRSDIYSLGKTIESLIKACLKPDSQIHFHAFIKKATDLDPANRFANMQEIINFINNHELLPSQLKQIKALIHLNAPDYVLDAVSKNDFNEKQIGVIKHCIDENIDSEIIKLLLENKYSSRQMWQIKKGWLDHLLMQQILIYAKPIYSAEEMSLMRLCLKNKDDIATIFTKVKNYNYIINVYQIDFDKLYLIRNYFINHLHLQPIETLVNKDHSLGELKLFLQTERNLHESKIS